MPMHVSKSVWVEFAHFMPGHPVKANQRVHGHSVKVTVAAEAVDGPFPDLDVFACSVQAIAGMLDHRFLNEDFPEIAPPTLENIATWIGERMAVTGNTRTVSVRVERPSRDEFAEWTP